VGFAASVPDLTRVLEKVRTRAWALDLHPGAAVTHGWRWLLALGTVLGCGGRAVVDAGPGADGGAGDGGAGGADVIELPACAAWCEVQEACGYIGSCMDHCLEKASYLTPCEAEFEAFVACAATRKPLDPPACTEWEGESDCSDELDALYACVYPTGPCETERHCTLSGPNTFSECTATCGGVVYTSACEHSGLTTPFPMDCACQVDGETVGTCQNVTGDGSVGFDCCSEYFADSG
jgi:hypothetical protein